MLETEYLGILDASLTLSYKPEDGRFEHGQMSMHILYSVYEGKLYAHCLDMNLRERIDIREERGRISLNDHARIASVMINRVTEQVLYSIIDHLISYKEDAFTDGLLIHAAEEYWKEFRAIKLERDQVMFSRIFNKGISDIFLDTDDQLKGVLENLFAREEVVRLLSPKVTCSESGVRRDLVKIIEELAA